MVESVWNGSENALLPVRILKSLEESLDMLIPKGVKGYFGIGSLEWEMRELPARSCQSTVNLSKN